MAARKKYPGELRERAVRLVFESNRPIAQVARDLGIHHEALRKWVRQAEADAGQRGELLEAVDQREQLCLTQLREYLDEQAVATPLDEVRGWNEAAPALIMRAAATSLQAEVEWLRLVRSAVRSHLSTGV